MSFAATDEIRTERLRLRRWRADDLVPFAALNADPRVVEFLAGPLTRAESDAFVARIEAHFDAHGFGFFAVECLDDGALAGFVGLSIPRFDAPFTPCVEIGWRLAPSFQGRGYATEAARAALAYGFETVGLREIVSFTVPANLRSRRVMEKLGMRRNAAEDFDHPVMPVGHPLRPHVLYRLDVQRWQDTQEEIPG
jgi:RimJ/RimL family protein N-acetyltransferase